jgi:AcrR family transcriptional regulator
MISGAGSSRDARSAKLPHGPHTLSRQQVADHQRRRIIAAMVAAVGEHGYFSTTVADVIALAGVSRKAFYEHFTNKQDCFLTAFDVVIKTGLTQARDAFRSGAGMREGFEAAIGLLFEHAAVNPLAVRLVLIEAGAAGPEGVVRRERHMTAYEALLGECLGVATAQAPQPKPILRALVGGVSQVLFELVQGPRSSRPQSAVADLAAWMMAYLPVPAEISVAATHEGPPTRAAVGGRAPGTLSPPAAVGGRRGLRGARSSSHSYVIHSQRERVLDAVANLTSARGYAGVTVRDIADQAAISVDAFYAHFVDKEDAFLVAYEVGHQKSLAVVERAFREAPDWRHGIPAALEALFTFLADEPTYAHLALVDAVLATPRSAERARKGADAYAHMVAQGLEEAGPSHRPPTVTVAAITGGVFELCLSYVMQQRVAALPGAVREASYFVLAPFVGPNEAMRLADAQGTAAT